MTKLESLTQFLSRRQKRNAVIEVSERQNVADGLVDMVEDTADAASDVVEEAVEVAEEVVEETVGVVEDVAEGVSDAASDVVDEITDVVDEVIPGTGDAVDAVSDIGVAAGPLGRSFEADVGAVDGDLAPIYTYSLSKGFYYNLKSVLDPCAFSFWSFVISH